MHEGIGELWVWTAFWSADGTKILTGGQDGSVRVWDAKNGDVLLPITENHPEIGSWSPDEKYIFTHAWVMEAMPGFGNLRDELPGIEDFWEKTLVGKDVVKIWDASNGHEHSELNIGEGYYWANTTEWYPWSPSGDRVLAYFADGTVRIWEVETGELLQTLAGHQGMVIQALWSPDGELIASSGNEDGKLIIWNVDTGEALHIIPIGFEDKSVIVTRWSNDGSQVAVRGRGGAKVFDVSTGREILDLSVPRSGTYVVKWSPDGTRILTTHVQDGTARVWEAETGQEIFRKNLSWSLGADWSPSGDLIAVGGAEGWVNLYDGNDGHEMGKLYSTLETHFRVEFSQDGEQLLTNGFNNRVEVFDLSEALFSIPITTHGYVTTLDWSPDGKQFASGINDPGNFHFKIWDSSGGEEIMSLPGHEALISAIKWSPNGDRIATTSDDMKVRIWDATSGELLLTFSGHQYPVYISNWSPDGKLILSLDDGDEETSGTAIIWESSTGDEIMSFSSFKGIVYDAEWLPDGERILILGEYGEALIWEAYTGELLFDLLPEDESVRVIDAILSKDGDRIFLLSINGMVYIHDSETGKEITQFKTPETLEFTDISLSPTAERAIFGGAEGVATVWDTETGAEVIRYDIGGIVVAAYSPDGSRVVIANSEGNTGMIRVFPTWHSPDELIDYARECCLLRDLTPEERELFGLPPR